LDRTGKHRKAGRLRASGRGCPPPSRTGNGRRGSRRRGVDRRRSGRSNTAWTAAVGANPRGDRREPCRSGPGSFPGSACGPISIQRASASCWPAWSGKKGPLLVGRRAECPAHPIDEVDVLMVGDVGRTFEHEVFQERGSPVLPGIRRSNRPCRPPRPIPAAGCRPRKGRPSVRSSACRRSEEPGRPFHSGGWASAHMHRRRADKRPERARRGYGTPGKKHVIRFFRDSYVNTLKRRGSNRPGRMWPHSPTKWTKEKHSGCANRRRRAGSRPSRGRGRPGRRPYGGPRSG